MKAVIDETLDLDMADPAYAPKIKRMIAKAFDDVPRIPLWQPSLDSATRKDLSGYTTWFHRQPDVRNLTLAKA